MTRKPKTPDISEAKNTQGAEDSLKGAQPDKAEALQADPQEKAAAPAAEVDPSAAIHDAGAVGATRSPLVAPDLAASADGGRGNQVEAPDVHVTCLAPTGRRRAGRRWASGLTVTRDLMADEIAALRADPDFIVSVG